MAFRPPEKPLDLFGVQTDLQDGKAVYYVSLAYSRTRFSQSGDSFVAISPGFSTNDEMKAYIRLMIVDLHNALESVDGVFDRGLKT